MHELRLDVSFVHQINEYMPNWKSGREADDHLNELFEFKCTLSFHVDAPKVITILSSG